MLQPINFEYFNLNENLPWLFSTNFTKDSHTESQLRTISLYNSTICHLLAQDYLMALNVVQNTV
jgi:hypothetical protein